MTRNSALPSPLGSAFHVAEARAAGVGEGRLRGKDLERPFRGVRTRVAPEQGTTDRDGVLRLARAAAPLLGPDQFFSHETAAAIWGMPISLRPEVHVAVFGNASFARTGGITGHRALPKMASTRVCDGLPVASPATTWAMLGHRRLSTLVVAGDHLIRQWKDGVGRPHRGRPPLATRDELRRAAYAGRRRGAATLRAALDLVRTDAWSPRESLTRFELVMAGLPEPELNVDLFDARGTFLGCVDMVYELFGVIVEYQGQHHHETYARDVERLDRLRAEGWHVIEVTKELLADPRKLVARVRRALIAGGWRPPTALV